MDIHPRRWLILAGCALGLTSPQPAHAQACIGVPSAPGRYHLAVDVGKTGDITSYGAEVGSNFDGTAFGSARFSLNSAEDVNDDITAFGATLGIELPGVQAATVCPLAGAEYRSFSTGFGGIDFDANTTLLDAGVGVGTSLTSGDLTITPWAMPQFVYQRTRAEASLGGLSFDESDSETYFRGSLGVTVGFGQFSVGPSLSITSQEDSDTGIAMRFGVIF